MLDRVALFASGVAVGLGSAFAASRVFASGSDAASDVSDDLGSSSSDDDDHDDKNGNTAAATTHPPVVDSYEGDETYKMLLIFNMELYKVSSKTGETKAVKMSPGKAAAQSGHATLGAYRRAMRRCPKAVRDWLRIGQMKITVKCPTVEELLALEQRCAAAGLNTYLIRDAGHTEIEPGSRTVLAVGPAPASALDPFTRHLKPY